MAVGRCRSAITCCPKSSMAASSPVAPNHVSAIGSGHSRSVACTITPSVPSDPVSRRGRSYPVTVFTVRPPPFTMRPSPVATTTSSSESRMGPNRSRRLPLTAAASTPPTVALGSAGA